MAMATNGQRVSFKYGLKSNFNTPTFVKDENTVYFVTENENSSYGDIYVGSRCFTGITVTFNGSGPFIVGVSPTAHSIVFTRGNAVYGTPEAGSQDVDISSAISDALSAYVKTVQGSGAITIGGTTATPIVGLTFDERNGHKGNVTFSQSTNGLVGNVSVADLDIPEAGIQGVTSGDKFLVAQGNGIGASINITYDSEDQAIYLWGTDTVSPVAAIDTTDFVKDGMLSSASYANGTITLVFNTDGPTTPIEIDVSDLVDVYTAADGGGLTVTANAFAINNSVTPNTTGLNTDGITLNYGTTTTVQTIKYNGKGLITGADTYNVTLPSLPNFASPTGSIGGENKILGNASLGSGGLTGTIVYDVISDFTGSPTVTQIPNAIALYNVVDEAALCWEVFTATPSVTD